MSKWCLNRSRSPFTTSLMRTSLHAPLTTAILFILCLSSAFSQLYQPLTYNLNLDQAVSQDLGSNLVTVNIRNDANEELHVVWVDQQGNVHLQHSIPARTEVPLQSYPGHVFRIDRSSGVIVANFQVGYQPIQYYSVNSSGYTPNRTIASGTTAVTNRTGSQYQRLYYNPNLARVSVNQESYRVQLNLRNDTNELLKLVWLDQQGLRQVIAPIPARGSHRENPRPGYVLQVERANGTVVGNLQVSRQPVQNYHVDSTSLGGGFGNTGTTQNSINQGVVRNTVIVPISAAAVTALSNLHQFAVNLHGLVKSRRSDFATENDHQLAVQHAGDFSQWVKQAQDNGQAGQDKSNVRQSVSQATQVWRQLNPLLSSGSANGGNSTGSGFFQTYRSQGDSLLASASLSIGN